jgi:cytochrome c oxidase subunit 2
MKANIVVETQQEYDAWIAKQKSQYALAHESEGSGKPAPPASPAEPAKDSTQKAVAAL